MKRPPILWLRLLAFLKVGNAARRLGQRTRKRRVAALLTSNGVPDHLSGVASVAEPKSGSA